jgi:hypothetical protein
MGIIARKTVRRCEEEPKTYQSEAYVMGINEKDNYIGETVGEGSACFDLSHKEN